MDLLFEALIEAVLQIIFEVIVAVLDFLLESLLGHDLAERTRVLVSTLFYIAFGALAGWISVALLPKPIGGATPNAWIYLLLMPLLVAGLLFLGMKKSRSIGGRHSTAVVGWFCVCISWAFSVGRYLFIR